jgi:CheY-like chemotaxis protein
VLFAKNGREALDLFEKHQPAVVITDWSMPDISGLELCRLSDRRSGCIKCGLFSFSSTMYTTESSLLLQSFSSPYRSNRLSGRGEGATHMQQPGGVSIFAISLSLPELSQSEITKAGKV